MEQFTMFAEESRLQKLSELGDSLENLDVINWEMFRPELNRALKKERKSNAGRPPYDCILLFKILVLQRIYNLSDDQTEYQINDRMSFMRLLGLSIHSKVPDAKTIWLFRDTLTRSGVIDRLFRLFERQLTTFADMQSYNGRGVPWDNYIQKRVIAAENRDSFAKTKRKVVCESGSRADFYEKYSLNRKIILWSLLLEVPITHFCLLR